MRLVIWSATSPVLTQSPRHWTRRIGFRKDGKRTSWRKIWKIFRLITKRHARMILVYRLFKIKIWGSKFVENAETDSAKIWNFDFGKLFRFPEKYEIGTSQFQKNTNSRRESSNWIAIWNFRFKNRFLKIQDLRIWNQRCRKPSNLHIFRFKIHIFVSNFSSTKIFILF